MVQDRQLALHELRKLRARVPKSVPKSDEILFKTCLQAAEAYFDASRNSDLIVTPLTMFYGFLQLGKAAMLAAGIPSHQHPNKHGVSRKSDHNADGDHYQFPITIGSKTRSNLVKRMGDFRICASFMDDEVVSGQFPISQILCGHPDATGLFRELEHPHAIAARPVIPPDLGRFQTPQYKYVDLDIGIASADRNLLMQYLNDAELPTSWLPTVPITFFSSADGVYQNLELPSIELFGSLISRSDLPFTDGYPADPTLLRPIAPPAPGGKRWSRFTWTWLLLSGVSHLVRYETESWASMLKVDDEKNAADLIELLTRIEPSLPGLGLQLIVTATQLRQDFEKIRKKSNSGALATLTFAILKNADNFGKSTQAKA